MESLLMNIFSKLLTNQDSFPYDYIDFKGNVIRKKSDVLFTNRILLKQLSNGKKLSANELRKIIEDGSATGAFYSADELEPLKNSSAFIQPETEEILDLKISRFSGQLLPTHAGECKQLSIQYFGQPNVGKTLLLTQYCVERAMFSERMENKKLCLIPDTPVNIPIQNSRELAVMNYLNGKLMEFTRISEELLPHSFFVTYSEGESKKEALIEFHDIAGEDSKNQLHNSPIYAADYFLFLISPADLEDRASNMELENLITLINQIKNQVDLSVSKIMVVLTMCDLFRDSAFDDEIELQKLLETNTLEKKKRLRLLVHKHGYNMNEHNYRSNVISQFLQERYPTIYNSLELLDQEKNIDYFSVGSINKRPLEENMLPKEFLPYRIEEPFLYILSQYQLYPLLEAQGESDQEEEGYEWEDDSEDFPNCKNTLKKLLKGMRLL